MPLLPTGRASVSEIEVEFVGAAGEVTGSRHLVHCPRARILLDCGLVQGRRREALARNRELGVAAHRVSAVVISHAHLDHLGALPVLVREGFDGSVYATPATRDLAAAMLQDAAMVQKADARYINKAIARDGAAMDPVEPLYTEEDVVRALGHIVAVPYHRQVSIADGVRLSFFDAGHVLGSAVTCLDVEVGQRAQRLVFSGDLGRRGTAILRDPEVPKGADALLLESTYGGRQHPPIASSWQELAALLARVHARGGKVLIPAFALERAQEVLYALHGMQREGHMPPMPVYVDSPLTVRVTEVFRLHPDCFDEEARAQISSEGSPLDLSDLRYVADSEASKALDASDAPCVIISASGMCEGGRVVHHLKAMLGDPRNAVAIVGFQAQHTLGRRLVERRPRVRVFGVEREVRAEIVSLQGFSAHADHPELVDFAMAAAEGGRLGRVALVHGEAPQQEALRQALRARGIAEVLVPAPGDRMRVGPVEGGPVVA